MSEKIIGSNMPALASDQLKPSKAGYGQNGYHGASSDVPGERTTSGFLPSDPVRDTVARFGSAAMRAPEVGDNVESVRGTPASQFRDVSKIAAPTTFGMKNPNSNNPKVPGPQRSPTTRGG